MPLPIMPLSPILINAGEHIGAKPVAAIDKKISY